MPSGSRKLRRTALFVRFCASAFPDVLEGSLLIPALAVGLDALDDVCLRKGMPRPGRISEVLEVKLPHPRERGGVAFISLRREILDRFHLASAKPQPEYYI